MTGWHAAAISIPPDTQDDRCPSHFARLIDSFIELLLLALLTFMPFALGASEAWSQSIIMFAVTGLSLGLVLRSFSPDVPAVTKTWAFVPIALFCALIVFQLVPLPAGLIHAISPATLARKTSLLADIPEAPAALRYITLSFYPLASEHDLRLVLCACTLFIAVLSVMRSPAQIIRLLVAVVCIGASVAILAAAQDLSGAESIYWSIETPRRIANAGPFVLYNNFAQFMNLSIGAAIGLLLYLVSRQRINEGCSGPRARRSGGDRKLRRQPSDLRSSVLKWQTGLLIGFIVLAGCTVLLSGSRGGTLSLICSFFAVVVLMGRCQSMKRQSWFLLIIGGAIFGSLLYVGFDAVCDRLATLHNSTDPSSGRLQSFKDIGSIWRQFPIFGTGLGTHQFVYPAYDRSVDAHLAEQADGDYIQAAEEVGALGLAIVLFFVAVVWRRFYVAIRTDHSGNADQIGNIQTVSYGLGFGLFAVMLQEFVDFGQHLPAVGCLSAVFCALLVRLGSTIPAPQPVPSEDVGNLDRQPNFFNSTFNWGRLATIGLSVMLTAGSAWGCITAERVRQADVYAAQTNELADDLSRKGWNVNPDAFIPLLTASANAVKAEPRDVINQYWLNCYRWQAISRPAAGAEGKELSIKEMAFSDRIVSELGRSRLLCPVYGPTPAVMGEIEYFALRQNERAAREVALASSLSPNHPLVCLAAASVFAAENKWDTAVAYLRRCLLLDGSLFPQALSILLVEHHRPDLAVAVSDGDPARLLDVIQYLPRDVQSQSLAAQARTEALIQLDRRCGASDASAWILAQTAYLHRNEGNLTRAAELFRRALAIDYAQVGWRLELADLLKTEGKLPQAAHEAQICLRLRPQMPEAVQLIAQLNAVPGVHLDDLGQ